MAKKPTQKMFYDEVEDIGADESVEQKKPAQKKNKTKPVEQASVGSPDHNILDLPSKGNLWYPSSVEYRDILVKDEEVLSLATPETYARTLNSVLKGILNNCEFYEQLTLFDRDYILVWLWANNYTSHKDVEVTCRSCGHKETHRVDLTQVPVTEIKDDIPSPLTMPLSKVDTKINLRLNTVADELQVEKYMQKHPKSNFETLMLVSAIDVGVPMLFDQKVEWIKNNVTGREMGLIKQFHHYFKYGVNDTIEHTCSECQGVTRGPLPFQAEDVLFPTVSSDFEDFLRSVQSSEADTE